jgi:F0F1-type ATP synthase assembly protein I
VEKRKAPTDQHRDRKKENKDSSGLRSFTRYSGIGFQMIIIILLFYWAGSKLDERTANEKPVYTTILTLVGVFAGLYIILKDFIGRKDD